MTLEQARKTLAGLQAKFAELEQRRVDLEATRDNIAFDAIAIGDASAKAKLAKINADLVKHELDLSAMAAAIREGEARVQVAQGVARQAINQRNAEAALKRGADMIDALRMADKAFTNGFNALGDAIDAVQHLNRLGSGPSQQLVLVALRTSLASLSMGSPVVLEHIAPNLRHSIAELGEAWSKTVEHWASQRMPAEKDKAA